MRDSKLPLRGPSVRPISKAQSKNPREFQINQLRKRFSPQEESRTDGLDLRIRFQPTDPDFPFELDALVCVLYVPFQYPSSGARPSLRVENTEMDRGYQINVEKGFDHLVSMFPSKTLLSLMNELDKNLESFLTSEKASTIKLIANLPRQTRLQNARIGSQSSHGPANVLSEPDKDVSPEIATRPRSERQIYEAHVKRQSEIRQLEARLGRQSLFSKSSDGNTFTIPSQLKTPGEMPIWLQQIKTFKLIVPDTYPVDPCVVSFDLAAEPDVRLAEEAFQNEASSHPERTLLAHLNFFAQHAPALIAKQRTKSPEAFAKRADPEEVAPAVDDFLAASVKGGENSSFVDKPHVHFVPRPPEWILDDDGIDDASSSCHSNELSDDDDNADGGVPVFEEASESMSERGVSLSFPHMELYGIEVLELVLLSITVKCSRCKETKDMKNIRPQASSNRDDTCIESCNKCANSMTVGKFETIGPRLTLTKISRLSTRSHACEFGPRWISRSRRMHCV